MGGSSSTEEAPPQADAAAGEKPQAKAMRCQPPQTAPPQRAPGRTRSLLKDEAAEAKDEKSTGVPCCVRGGEGKSDCVVS
mmetsp:Transcript_2127/g.3613  ORF Transcript_2127/g.3613 Transcript_2127/m.3613 type:complete len:80 (+) Transcript_2127:56-295(+)